MAEANYVANEGSPEQLPRGEAAALNEGINVQEPATIDITPPAEEAQAAEEGQDLATEPEDGADDLQPAEMADYDAVYEPASEDDQFITGPTNRPDEEQWVGTAPRSPITPTIRRRIGLLQEAASDPEASAELRALVSYLLRIA